MTKFSREPDALHAQLCLLWDKAVKGEGIATVVVDPHTYRALLYSRDANNDGSIDILHHNSCDGSKRTWRGLTMVLRALLPAASDISKFDEIPAESIYQEPFCMYMIMTKANGRISYIDNPNTEKQFL